MPRWIILLFTTVSLWCLPLQPDQLQAFSPTGCEGDCAKCHALSNQEVKGVLQRMKKPQAEILNIQMSPLKGLWEISVEDKGQRGLFYIDFSKNISSPVPSSK